MKRIKAWFHSKVVEAVQKAWAELENDIKRVFQAYTVVLFEAERKKTALAAVDAENKLRTIALEVHQNAMMKLASEMRQKMDAELKAFEARVNHTLTACIKDEPAHWRADEDTKSADHELKKVK